MANAAAVSTIWIGSALPSRASLAANKALVNPALLIEIEAVAAGAARQR
jgi:hypothetical protein